MKMHYRIQKKKRKYRLEQDCRWRDSTIVWDNKGEGRDKSAGNITVMSDEGCEIVLNCYYYYYQKT